MVADQTDNPLSESEISPTCRSMSVTCWVKPARFSWFDSEGGGRGIIAINEPVDYMARAVMILMRGKDIMRAIGRGGP